MTLHPGELAQYLHQQKLAETGDALNQCPECGSYRLDGQRPYLHLDTCSQYAELNIDQWIRNIQESLPRKEG